MFFWHVPAPDEALLISGSKHQPQDTQFRIVIGHGSFVLPIMQKARILSLALREAKSSKTASPARTSALMSGQS